MKSTYDRAKVRCSFSEAIGAVNAIEQLLAIGVLTKAEADEAKREIRGDLGLTEDLPQPVDASGDT